MNVALEMQAFHRCTRIGQARAVAVTFMVARGTVEERILGLRQNVRRAQEYFAAPGEGGPRAAPAGSVADISDILALLHV